MATEYSREIAALLESESSDVLHLMNGLRAPARFHIRAGVLQPTMF